MREIIQIADQLENFTKELGVTSYAGFLEETNQSIRKMVKSEVLQIDLFLHSHATAAARKCAQQIIDSSSDPAFKIRQINEQSEQARVFSQPQTSVLLFIVDETCSNTDFLAGYKQNEQYRIGIFINCTEDERLAQIVSRQMHYRVKSFHMKAAEAEGKNIQEILQVAIEATMIDKLKRYNYLNSVKPLFGFMKEIIDAENLAANTRKLLNTQNANITRKDEQGMNNNDFVQAIRQMMQKNAQELDKNFKIKYEDLNKPNTGKFSMMAAERVSLLEDFERTVLAEKSEKVQTTINEKFQKDFLDMIGRATTTELGKDEAFIKSSFEDLLSKVNFQLKSKGIKTISEEDAYVPFPDKLRTVSTYCYYNRMYTGELIKKGAMEYFVALRDYTGLIMVVGGLLAPLSIIASASDNGIFKSIATWVKASTALISLLMIIYGIYDLRKRIPLKRKEEFERELAKAKEMILQESKRMFSESSRDWTTNISNWIRDVSTNISNTLEKNLKELQTNKVSQMNNEKIQQQKLGVSLDNMLRNIQTADRQRDMMQTRHRDMLSELEKDLKL